MKFSVVIVNYNVKYYLEQCLCSLYRAIDNISAEIFVVDNASVDDSEAYLTERFPRITYIYIIRRMLVLPVLITRPFVKRRENTCCC